VNQEAYNEAVSARAEEMIVGVARREVHSMWSLHTRLRLDQASDDVITEVVARGLGADMAGFSKPQTGGPFHVLPAMLLLSRWEDKLPQNVIDTIHQFMIRGMLERGNTENHWLMFYAANLLAAERWRDETVFWNGRPPAAMEAEATRWIAGNIDRTAMVGHHEYDSPGYHIEHMMPLIGLYEHTSNDDLRAKVEKVLSMLVGDAALEYFYGSWAGGHSREGYRENTWTRVGPIRPLQYLYFGGEPFNEDFHLQQAFAFPALVAAYRPPALFADIAWDRQTPHVVKKSKAPRNIYRHTDAPAKPVRKYTYMSRSFAMGTSQIGLPSDSAGPIDLISWDLHWRGEKHQAKVTCNHPFTGPSRFSAFLTPIPQTAGRAIGSDKPYLQRPDRLFGASPFERMMQHEGTTLILYRIPESDACPFVNLYLPKRVDWTERDGWLFGNLDDFYLAVRPIGPYEWLEIRESRNDAIMVTNSDLIDGWLLRIQDCNAGLVVEAIEAGDVASFEAYCESRSGHDVNVSGWPSKATASVKTHDGKVMVLDYDGAHTIDGTVIDYDGWPMYESPNAKGTLGTGKVAFEWGGDEVELDFEVDTSSELMPMRVIG
jgi:hypothetical protein